MEAGYLITCQQLCIIIKILSPIANEDQKGIFISCNTFPGKLCLNSRKAFALEWDLIKNMFPKKIIQPPKTSCSHTYITINTMETSWWCNVFIFPVIFTYRTSKKYEIYSWNHKHMHDYKLYFLKKVESCWTMKHFTSL